MQLITVQNRKTGQKYDLDQAQWQAIQEKGWASRYKVINTQTVTPGLQYIPGELKRNKTAADKPAQAAIPDAPGGKPDGEAAAAGTEQKGEPKDPAPDPSRTSRKKKGGQGRASENSEANG